MMGIWLKLPKMMPVPAAALGKKALKRPPSDPNDPYHTFIFGLDNGKVIDASLDGNDARWINHSCDPNCEAIEEEDGGVFIYAMRTIQPGEELNYDYRLSVDGKPSKKERKRYACHCGSENCRGTMLDV